MVTEDEEPEIKSVSVGGEATDEAAEVVRANDAESCVEMDELKRGSWKMQNMQNSRVMRSALGNKKQARRLRR